MDSKKNIRTNWDLNLLYSSNNDVRIEDDLVRIENCCSTFEKKYSGSDFTSAPEILIKALKDYEELCKEISCNKPGLYFYLKSDLDSADDTSRALSTKYEERVQKATNKIMFFDIAIGRIPHENRSEFLNFPDIHDYQYFLKRIFDQSQYFLTEKEEKMASLLSTTSYSMWVDGQSKVLAQKTIEYKGAEIPLSQAVSILSDEPKEGRLELQTKVNAAVKSNIPFAEAEINAVFNYKKTMDELRGYKKPYSSTVLAYENEERNVEDLVRLVSDNFSLSQRFYSLHAKLLNEKKIHYSDRNVKIGKIEKKFDIQTSIDIIGNAFEKVDPKYKQWLEEFFSNGQIDVFPNKGKRDGAYCLSMDDVPTFILLNHADNINSFETLAHEMGHAIHAELSDTQPTLYKGHSISTAEVASTFFEQVALIEVEKYLSKEEQIVLLHNRIMGDMSTIFLQITGFNFELELHNSIRVKGQVSGNDMAVMLKKHLEKYFGEVVDVTLDDAYFFVRWSHIRSFFYVYSYAYGQIISRAMVENWQNDNSYAKKVEEFLSLGRSMSPEDIFKKIGIDTSTTKFFESGLLSIKKDIDRLEELTKDR